MNDYVTLIDMLDRAGIAYTIEKGDKVDLVLISRNTHGRETIVFSFHQADGLLEAIVAWDQ